MPDSGPVKEERRTCWFRLLPALLACGAAACAGTPSQSAGPSVGSGGFLVWAHADIQPRTERDSVHYALAVRDVRDHIGAVSVAVVAGDLVEEAESEAVYDWAHALRDEARIPVWLQIAGNHEWKNIDLYREKVKKPLRYTAAAGNLLFILMSNDREGSRTYLSDDTFHWWRRKVIDNQDKIIVTVTHAALKQSGLAASLLERVQIIESERFAEVLTHYRVDIWISGHSHLPEWSGRMHYGNPRLGGTTFIDVGAIRRDLVTDVESRILRFAEGSRHAELWYRNHTDRAYTMKDDVRLSHPFTLEAR